MPLANAKQILADMFDQGERDFRSLSDQLREADLSGIHLEGCDLSGLDLAAVNFTQANLERTNLTGANLGFATLVDATLTRATLRNADLTCARVERADLRFCVLAGANLSSANLLDSQLEPSIFTGAIYNAKTQFPQGFDRSNKGLVRAAPVSQSPSLASIVDAPPSSLTDTSPLRSVGRRRPQPPTDAATPQPSADTQSNPNDPDGQSQTSRSTPPKRRVLFRGRWVEM